MQNMDLFDDTPGLGKGHVDGKGSPPLPSDFLRAKVEALVTELKGKKIQDLSAKDKVNPQKMRSLDARYHPDTWVRQVTAIIGSWNLSDALFH